MASSKPKKVAPSPESGRKQKLAALESAHQASQRRRTALLLSICAVLAVALLAYPAYLFINDARLRSLPREDLGVSLAAASCSPVEKSPAHGNQQHVPDGTAVSYDRLPPDSGPHYSHWAPFSKHFYSASERPEVQELVHNLEHGYTLAWYNPDLPADDLDALRRISKTFSDNLSDRFIAAPWAKADGPFPAGKNIVLARWYADPRNPSDLQSQRGVRQSCGSVSGQAIMDFMKNYPATDAPEPNGG